MLAFLRNRFIESLVAISAIATLLAFILPEGAFDTNPDNTLPIEVMLPHYVQSPGSHALQIILTSSKPQPSGDTQLTFVLVNSGKLPVYYTGYTPYSYSPRLTKGQISPLYKIQTKVGTLWQGKDLSWCGNGVKSMRLLPGHVAQFTVWQHPTEPTIRIGVPFHFNTNAVNSERGTVWSAVIDPK
jgi:hypothetical protein